VLDAVTAGEGEGPLEPSDFLCGAVFAGMNPLAVDAAAARFMGLSIDEIPQLKRGFELSSLPLFDRRIDEIGVQDNQLEKLDSWSPNFRPFRLPAGWQRVKVSAATAGHYASLSSRCE